MLRGTLAQNEAGIHCSSGPLAKIVLKAADRLVIEAFGKQKGIQIELDRMESQKTSRNVIGLSSRRAFTKLDGRVSVLCRQI
ncbi:hypothetical protein [Ensifer sp. B1-9]|uniref:hypothetical protein n=1 Tax=Ensifer sp. B1-9 TaxID=3141455 RepID=UPI003D19AC26